MSQINVELYHADWCGHCKNFMPTWKKLSSDLNKRTNIKCTDYEASRDENKMKEENIDGYPTIKIKVNDKKEEYEGKRDYETIHKHVINLQKKSTKRYDSNGNLIETTEEEVEEKSDEITEEDVKHDKKMDKHIYLFYANWCGYCINFKPVWNAFKKVLSKLPIEIKDFENDYNKDEIAKQEQKYGFSINSFPTIYMINNGKVIKYGGNRDPDDLLNAIITNLNLKVNRQQLLQNINNNINQSLLNEENMQNGGKRNNKNFYEKYLKYKAKYLKLRKQKNQNKQ